MKALISSIYFSAVVRITMALTKDKKTLALITYSPKTFRYRSIPKDPISLSFLKLSAHSYELPNLEWSQPQFR